MHANTSALPPNSKYISRATLEPLLQTYGHQGLTFLSAPAGYGKSWTVAAWLHAQTTPYLWLTLEKTHHCVESLLHQIQQITQENTPFILVLDHYHKAENAQLNELLLSFFNALSRVAFIVISHNQPPKIWSPLFAKKHTLLLDTQALRFSKSEINQLLKQSPWHTQLTIDHWLVISQYCYYFLQGWPALTQLLLQSTLPNKIDPIAFMQDQANLNAFIAEKVYPELSYEEKNLSFIHDHPPILRFFLAQQHEKKTTQKTTIDAAFIFSLLETQLSVDAYIALLDCENHHSIVRWIEQQFSSLECLDQLHITDWLLCNIETTDFIQHETLIEDMLLFSLANQNRSACKQLISILKRNNLTNDIEKNAIQNFLASLNETDFDLYSKPSIEALGNSSLEKESNQSWLVEINIATHAPTEAWLIIMATLHLSHQRIQQAQETIHQLINKTIQTKNSQLLLHALILLGKSCQLSGHYTPLIQAQQFIDNSSFFSNNAFPLTLLMQLTLIPWYLMKGELNIAYDLLQQTRFCLDQSLSMNHLLYEYEWHLCHMKWQLSQSRLNITRDEIEKIQAMEACLCADYLMIDMDSKTLLSWRDLNHDQSNFNWPLPDNNKATFIQAPLAGWHQLIEARLLQNKGEKQQAYDALTRLYKKGKNDQNQILSVTAVFYLAELHQEKYGTTLDALTIELEWCSHKKFYGLITQQHPSVLTLLKNINTPSLQHLIEKITQPLENATSHIQEIHPVAQLSKREQQILGLIAEGLSNDEIALTLRRSVGTIKLHAHNIYKKLEVTNRLEATDQLNGYLKSLKAKH